MVVKLGDKNYFCFFLMVRVKVRVEFVECIGKGVFWLRFKVDFVVVVFELKFLEERIDFNENFVKVFF